MGRQAVPRDPPRNVRYLLLLLVDEVGTAATRAIKKGVIATSFTGYNAGRHNLAAAERRFPGTSTSGQGPGTAAMHRTLGYAGHKTDRECIPPSLKPGDTLTSLATKYASIAANLQHESEPAKLNYLSWDKLAFSNVSQKDYRVPDKRGISVRFLDTEPPSKPFLAQTMLSTIVRETSADVHAFKKLTEEELKAGFDAIADEEGTVDSRKVKHILASAMRCPVPVPWLVDKFRGYYARYGARPDGRTDWAEFWHARTAVIESAQGEAASRPVGCPDWIVESRKVPRRVATVMDAKSSYQNEIDAPGENPRNRPYCYKATMAGSTLDILTGTTKHTYTLPGYGGTIPGSLRHDNVRLHAEKRQPHPPRNDLLLSYSNNMPGYTGKFPVYALESCKPRDFGLCALTSSGAANLGLML